MLASLPLVLVLLARASTPAIVTSAVRPGPDELGVVGRYASTEELPDRVIEVRERDGILLIQPIFWRPARRLNTISRDLFRMDDRAERRVRFQRDARGAVVSMEVFGLGYTRPLRRLAPGEETPVELIVRGETDPGIARLLAAGSPDPECLAVLARRMSGIPTQVGNAVAFLERLTSLFPACASLEATLADALVAAGNRGEALGHYAVARSIDPARGDVVAALERLGAGPVDLARDRGWTLPFALSDLLVLPRADEIAAVRAGWARRDLAPGDVELLETQSIEIGGGRATLRLIAHPVLGSRHVAALIVPVRQDGERERRPLLLEAKGVSWDYFPLRIPGGLNLPEVLGPDWDRYVYAIPGFRGEAVEALGRRWVSGGDRSDAWDGATDDALALLNVALGLIPEADPERIGVFGRSRGAAVALLAAARDPRIRAAVAWAAPTDWFRLMGLDGWTQEELVADGLRHRAPNDGTGGQFIDYFLRSAIAGESGLEETRRHLIGSSVLYFADSIRSAELHYGVDDRIVPVRNGIALAARDASRAAGARLELVLHEGAGHDQDLIDAPRQTREYYRRRLLENSTDR